MLYLIVNNDFHLTNLENQKNNFAGFDICIIRVPYHLTQDCLALSSNIITIDTPYRDLKRYVNPWEFRKAKIKVNDIDFTNDDVVIFLTEYDPINQYIIYKAKLKGARTILLEEGISTYYNNIVSDDNVFTFKDFINSFYLKYIIGFKFLEFNKLGNLLFLQLNDKFIDELLLYKPIKLQRNIKTTLVNNGSYTIEKLDENKCFFLNQPIYQLYLTTDEYLVSISSIIHSISRQFSEVYFKFHPRDDEFIRSKIKVVVEKYQNVFIISEGLDILSAANKFKPHFAISFFSDALFKLSDVGLEMVFFFHLIPKLNNHPLLMSLSKVLEQLNYKYPKSFSDITITVKGHKSANGSYLAQIIKEGSNESFSS